MIFTFRLVIPKIMTDSLVLHLHKICPSVRNHFYGFLYHSQFTNSHILWTKMQNKQYFITVAYVWSLGYNRVRSSVLKIPIQTEWLIVIISIQDMEPVGTLNAWPRCKGLLQTHKLHTYCSRKNTNCEKKDLSISVILNLLHIMYYMFMVIDW